jgi:curved DNA-binding protein
MTTHYSALGLSPNASDNEIKKAYRKLAFTHHPDRGGDSNTFNTIYTAYKLLSTPDKKLEYDLLLSTTLNDSSYFKNPDITIKVKLTLEQSWSGATVNARFTLLDKSEQEVILDIPKGVTSGQIIKYSGLGETCVKGCYPGTLNVYIDIVPSKLYVRDKNDLLTKIEISAIDAILGITKYITTIDDRKIPVNVLPGTNNGHVYRYPGLGFTDLKSSTVGDLVVVVDTFIPCIKNPNILKELHALNQKIASL